jgi:hypothetical protein
MAHACKHKNSKLSFYFAKVERIMQLAQTLPVYRNLALQRRDYIPCSAWGHKIQVFVSKYKRKLNY